MSFAQETWCSNSVENRLPCHPHIAKTKLYAQQWHWCMNRGRKESHFGVVVCTYRITGFLHSLCRWYTRRHVKCMQVVYVPCLLLHIMYAGDGKTTTWFNFYSLVLSTTCGSHTSGQLKWAVIKSHISLWNMYTTRMENYKNGLNERVFSNYTPHAARIYAAERRMPSNARKLFLSHFKPCPISCEVPLQTLLVMQTFVVIRFSCRFHFARNSLVHRTDSSV